MGNTEANLGPPKDCHEALVRAVKAQDAYGVTSALQHGADPNSTCNYSVYRNNPVLSCAVNKGYTDVVKALVEARNINLNAEGTAYHTALREAAHDSKSAIVQLLLSSGADPNLVSGTWIAKSTPLEAASGEGCLDSCRLLLQHGADIESKTSAPLVAAIRNGHKEICKLLLKNGANPNPSDPLTCPLFAAAEEGHPEICRLLLQYGADINSSLLSPLVAAAKNGHLETCRLLLQLGADVCPLGTKPLFAAAKHGHLEVCRLLLLSGVNPDDKDSKGRTATDIAREKEHFKLADWLCSQEQLMKS